MMLRTLGFSLVLSLLATGLALAQAQEKDKGKAVGTPTKATITKVDPVKNNITLKYKDKDGKDVERTFDLKGDVKMFDQAGKVVTIQAYRIGDAVVVIEREGRLLEMRKDKDNKEKP